MALNIGMSSRGDEDELKNALGHALHQEVHLMDLIEKQPDNLDLVEELGDKVRHRQNIVKEWAGNRIFPPSWCDVKHCIVEKIHAQEALSNVARQKDSDPDEVKRRIKLLKEASERERIAVGRFLSGGKTVSDIYDNACVRCFDDLNLNPSEVVIKQESSVDEYESNKCSKKKAILIFIGLFIGVKILGELSKPSQ